MKKTSITKYNRPQSILREPDSKIAQATET